MVMNIRYTLVTLLATPALAQNWATYPQVPKTASINGFADPIYGKLPECAQSCVKENVDNTPCPYWDTGCLCIMPQWIDPVADCFAKNCKGSQVESASSLANSLCKSVGAWWGIGATESTLLASAIGDAAAASPTSAAASATESSSSAAASPTSTAAASPASSAASSAKAEATESKSAENAAAATTTHAASSAAVSTAAHSSAAASHASSAARPASSQSKPPAVSNSGAMASVAAMGAVAAVMVQLL